MKTKILITSGMLLCSLFVCNAQQGANGPTVYVYTPFGSQIAAILNTVQMDQNTYNNIMYEMANEYSESTILGPATFDYNCHGYAWSMVDHGPTCWLNDNNNFHQFWYDGSYQETTEAEAEKIYYFGQHSAVKSEVPGYYESKWGPMALMRHLPGDGPDEYYQGVTIKYYKRSPPPPPTLNLSGENFVPCSGSKLFSLIISSAPYSAPVLSRTWSVSSNLQIVSGQGTNSIVVSKSSASQVSRDGTVSVTVVCGGDYSTTLTQNVKVGLFYDVTSISGPSSVTTGNQVYYSAAPNFDASLGNYEWDIYPSTGYTMTANRNSLSITFNQAETYTIYCRSVSSCNAPSEYQSILVSASSGSLYSVAVGASRQISIAPTSEELKSIHTLTSYSLYNQATGAIVATGKMPISGGTLDFSRQPSGIYILTIETPNKVIETYRIILK
jgi:hypothetical protein